MVSFILFHKGSVLPQYIVQCIKQIQYTQSNYKIYLLTDINIINTGNIEVVDLNTIKIDLLNEIGFYKHHDDPLWRTSFDRFFYIDAFIRERKIEDVVHFDNDVLIYYDVNEILTTLRKNVTKVGLTKHKVNEFVCGFMYIKHYNNLLPICDKLLELGKIDISELERMLGSMPHEMRLLGYIDEKHTNLLTSLPGLPEPLQQNGYGIVFDPSTYGQFLGGSGNAPAYTIHPSNTERLIDRYIVDGTIRPVYNSEESKPYIFIDNRKIPIFNLHIHSKHLSNFCKF
jgi:hypothetical protein